MRWKLILSIAIMVVPSPALADWQNTTWFMNREQVAAATGASLTEESGRGARLGARGLYEALGYRFESRFYFDEADRLSQVRLVLSDPALCGDLHRTMQGLYGQPIRQSGDMAEWLPGEDQDGVRVLHPTSGSSACEVLYWPRIRTGAAGL